MVNSVGRPFALARLVPLTGDGLERVDRRQTGIGSLLCLALALRLGLAVLAYVARVSAGAHQLARLVRLGARQRQAGVRIRSQAERLATAANAVVRSPAMRAAFDEQKQVEPTAVVEPLARVARLDCLDRGVPGDQFACHVVTSMQ